MSENETTNKPKFDWSFFGTIPSWLLRSQTISDGAKLFFCALSATCRETGECRYSNRELADELRCGERSVSRWVKELEATGIISYKVVGATETDGNRERRVYLEWKPNRHAKIGETANIGESVGDSPAKIGETHLLKRNKKPPIVPQGDNGVEKLLADYAGGDTELLAALTGFAENRGKLKKPIKSARSVTLLTNRLDKLSGGSAAVKIAMLDKATLRNWETVYALNERDLEDVRPAAPEEESGEEAFGRWH